MKIYHNNRCRKSRETLKLIQDKNVEVEIIDYLNQPPSIAELEQIIMKLDIKPEALVRKGEKVFKEKLKGLDLNDHEWIKVLSENPILIERPIVVKGNTAVLGRPPENVEKLL